MSDNKLAKLIFEKWVSSLRDKSRKWDSVKNNFEELFLDMYKSSVPFDVAHDYVKVAIAAHSPSNGAIKNTYRKVRRPGQSEKEFVDEWLKGIEDFCVQSFHTYYEIPVEGEKLPDPEPKDAEDKHVERLRKFSKPLTAEKFAELLARQKQIEEENNE